METFVFIHIFISMFSLMWAMALHFDLKPTHWTTTHLELPPLVEGTLLTMVSTFKQGTT